MTLYTADRTDKLINDIKNNAIGQVYLIFGERFLCRKAADKICQVLIDNGGMLHAVVGDSEPFSTTLNKLSSFSLFPGRQVFRITDTKLFHTVKIAQSLWKKCVSAWQNKELKKAAQYLGNMLETAGLDPTDPENDPGSLSAARWKKLFSFAKPQGDLSWTGPLLAKIAQRDQKAAVQVSGDDASLLEQALESGIPSQNVAVLIAEDVDKRKRLYKYLVEKHVALDLSVESGSSSRAQTAQKKVLNELIRKTLAGFDKTMAADAAELLCERVGFHPVAVVMETEKLALYTGPSKQITPADLDEVVGRTRQEALFELTDALGKRELERALLVAERLGENGIHPLAVVATLKNYTRNLMLFRALLEQPQNGYSPTMSPAIFQQQVLPRLKQREQWKRELSGHPFALFMQFKTASGFPLSTLKKWLGNILHADMRLKGSSVEPDTIVQHLLIGMLAKTDKAILQKNH